MEAKIIFYNQNELDQNTKFKLRRELLGVKQKSNFSRYEYKVEGILNKIPNYRPVTSSIIVESKNVKIILSILAKFNAKYEVFDINLPKSKMIK
jgi:hypothetical protein